MEISKEFGQKICKYRKKMNLSQEEFAEKCDLSLRHISTIERGKTNPKLETVLKICSACEIDTGELLMLAEEESKKI